MNCRKACSGIALDAGGDLSGRRRARLEKHLAGCPACREEKRRIEKSLALARELARDERTPDFTDAEWRKLMGRTTSQEIARRKASAARLPGWAWAAGSALLLILIVGGTVVLRKGPGGQVAFVPAERASQKSLAQPEKTQASPGAPAPRVAAPAPAAPLLEARKAESETVPAAPKVQEAAKAKEAVTARRALAPAGAAQPVPAPASAAPQPQTVMAMTFVSQETGLQIHWVFNDAFNYKEKGK
jgi:hypothetical protein